MFILGNAATKPQKYSKIQDKILCQKKSDIIASSSSSNVFNNLIDLKSLDIPSTSKCVDKNNQKLTSDILSKSRSIAKKFFETYQKSSIPVTNDDIEKIFSVYFLINPDPTDADLDFLCNLTKRTVESIKTWFIRKHKINIKGSSKFLCKNQIPLALLYFKKIPDPDINEITLISRVLGAERLAIYRWYKVRRKSLKMKSSDKYSFEYSVRENVTLEDYFKNLYENKYYEIENVIQLGKEMNIDEIKVEYWFSKKFNYLSRRYYKLKQEYKIIPDSLEDFMKKKRLFEKGHF